MPVSGRGRAVSQPIWAEDVADFVMSALRSGGDGGTVSTNGGGATSERYELAGPETLTYDDIIRTALRSLHRERPLAHFPTPLVSRALHLGEKLAGERNPATWDEAELLEANMISRRGAADAEALGVTPQPMSAVLGVG
jgi:uncharacterized protein YbjT (DUF2867 family)